MLRSADPFKMSQTLKSAPSSPMGRLSRKVGDMSLVKTPASASRKANMSIFGGGGKTPNQSLNQSSINQSALFAGTGAAKPRGLSRRELTPSRNSNMTCTTTGGGDRFIPSRSQTQLEYASFIFSQAGESSLNTSTSAPSSPQKAVNADDLKKKQMMRAKSSSDLCAFEEDKIFIYNQKAPLPPAGHLNQPKVLYSTTSHATSSVRKTSRFIPTTSEKVLDAPGFSDDFYANLLDWSESGLIAVALGFDIYLWNHETGDTYYLVGLDESNVSNQISSIKWDKDGKHLAVGTCDGSVRLYDPERANLNGTTKELRRMYASRSVRAGALTWRNFICSSGHRSGQIFHHDVRIPQHVIGSYTGHSQEVCGLKWSPDNRILASGSGDQIVNTWDVQHMSTECTTPQFSLNEHQGTVRALAWCPWKSSVLLTGGGIMDQTVKIWDAATGFMRKSINVGSQVCDILFNQNHQEVMTAHGNPDNAIKIWKYSSFAEVATLGGHTGRVLSLSPSPCGQLVMSASADESLRLWNCFMMDKSVIKQQRKMGGTIR